MEALNMPRLRHVLTRRLVLSGLMLGAAVTAPAYAMDAFEAVKGPLDYIGSVEFFPEAGALSAGWTVRIAEDDLDEISFALSSAFGTASVAGADVVDVTTELDERFGGAVRTYRIDLAPSVNGADRIVKFAYGGPLFPEELPLPINTLDSDKIELTVDSFWFPFDARFDSDLTARVQVRLAGEWSAVGVGSVVSTPKGFHFVQAEPALDIAFSLLSNSEVVKADDYVIHDARSEPGTKLEELTGALEFCTAYLNGLAGPAGPLPQASIIVTDRPEGGYSRGTLIALTDIEDDDEEYLLQFICHELAHYWSKANAGGPENWINEGLADYLANMGVRNALGETVFDARMARYAEQIEGHDLPPIWAAELTERPPYLIMYRAAPVALQHLEERMGRATFTAFMQRIMTDRVRTTPALLALLEEMAGAEIRTWFETRLAD
ncbi:hypothetical protein GCM10007853_19930 [Algimonas ampicilliniresistens]|uniref:Peptidase M1 membrane alanine aminopeptidase domain-containing protein n=1 Tax=Algimonas ampicilliniresistens TaxID=1298735 RepID=A0ABQ5VBI4_9PROT|nr:hypothetical protein GCM10007853_19930 [Algimonas ampicilliniresistens]